MKTHVIVRPGGLGDSLLVAPALQQLKAEGDCRIRLVGYPDRLRPVARAGLADSILSLDDWLSRPVTVADFEDHTTETHEVVVHSFFPLTPSNLPSGVSLRFFPPAPEPGSGIHVAKHIGRCLGIEVGSRRESPLKSLLQKGFRGLRRTVWVHPGAGGRKKRWPLPNYLDLADRLGNVPGLDPVFILGEADGDLEPWIRGRRFEVETCEDTESLTSLFEEGDLFIGNDSGPTHLAALMGLSTVALFGDTDPVLWSPWGESVRILRRRESRDWPTVDETLDGVLAFSGKVGERS